MLEEDCLSVLLNALLESGADMCVGGCRQINNYDEVIREIHVKNDITVTPEEYLENFFKNAPGYMINAWNKLMKKETATKIVFPEGMNYEDRATFVRLISAPGKIRMVSNVTYVYDVKRPGSITSTYSLKNLEDYLKASELLTKDIRTCFPAASCVQNYLERQELENTANAWKYNILYLNHIKENGSPEEEQQLISLKKQYKEIIKKSRSINKIPRCRARILLHLIRFCPCFAECLYVSREKLINRKNHV